MQIEAKSYETAPYRGIRLPTRLAASSAVLERARLRAAGLREHSTRSVEFRTERSTVCSYILRGALGGVNSHRIRKSFGGPMSQLGSAEIGAYRIRRGADFRSHRKIWVCFAGDTAALLRKILTLRLLCKRSMVKFRRQNLDYAGKISSKFKGSQAARALINPYGPMSRCDPRI